jgi:AraC family ethanolamine operon transcriptional activator
MSPPKKILPQNFPNELREVSVLELTDPVAVRGTIEILDQDVVNLDTQSFHVKRVTVPCEECCLVYVWSSAALRSRTLVHEDFDICTVLGPKANGTVDGAELHPHAMIAAGHGAHVEIVIQGGYESILWLVPPKVLDQQLALRGAKSDFRIPEHHEVWHPAEEEARGLFELGKRIAETAENTPAIFNDNRRARHSAQVEYMDLLSATIESCDAHELGDSDRKRKSYSAIVRACEDYTLQLDDRRPYLSELCETAHVSERTLQYAFHDIMGMSPLTYLHRLRLHRARDEMLKAKNKSTTVTDVAMNWGFWHFGEFSRAYKNCFGELPSETLKSNSNS